MTGHISRSHLHRLDDTTWSYLPSHEGEISENEFEEIRLQIPPIRRGANAYKLIRAITRTFEHNRGMITRDLFKKGFDVKIPIPEKGVTETWNISFHRFSCISNRIFNTTLRTIRNFFPASRMLKKRATAFCEAHRRDDGLLKRIASCFRRTVTLPNQPPNTLPLPTDGKMVLPTAQNPVERIQAKGFQDSFSRLSTVAFETVEKFFVMERTHRGTFRFIVDADAKLSLEEDEITPKGEVEIARYLDQNRAAVRAYRDFLLSEFGPSFVSQIELSYNIHFNTMIEEGLPLYPDHVSKCNIGANSIELCHVERVWEGLNKILKLLRQGGDTPSQAQLQAMTQQSAAEFLVRCGGEIQFPLRTLRGLLRSIPHAGKEATVNDLYQYLSTIIGETPPKTVRSLPPALFNQVVDMIMPSDEERSAAFTGRRIRHLSVMGFNTMGKPNIANPARDLFELLHIFDDCRKKEDWKNFFELLAHVVVKKSIFRDTPSSGTAPQQVHVGLLIPAPDSQSGQRRWYFNESFFDDGQGNVNYVLLPACDGYTSEEGRTLPMVKLYRSTASNKNAEDFQDSIAADLNPYGAPGSINPDLSFKYEREHFEQRTIPLWMGHLIMALRMKGWEQGEKASEERSEVFSSSYKEHLLEAGTLCKSYIQVYHPGTELMELLEALQSEDTERLEKRLIEYGEMFHENPRYKISQDLACVGHSLGAALSQAGIYYFSTHLGRIPVPGHQFICYSSDGPGVDNSKDAEFMRFGHRHRELFRFLHVGWKIYHQFEYGDIVAEAGESSLGTTGYRQKKDRQWLDESIVVFRPLPGEALPIITAPTHGRRIGMAEQEVDYTLTSVTPKELSEFHHSMWLRQKIRRIWGYKFLNSPRVSELIRRTSGQALRPEMKLYTYFERNGIGIRDKDGVLAVRYAPEETQVPHTL